MKSRYEGSQNLLWSMREGCYFLCLLSIAEEYLDEKVDLIDSVRHCMDKGWLTNDYYVNDACAILKWLCDVKDVRWKLVQSVGILKDNEYSLEKWKCGEKTHFRRRYFDVYENSKTVKDGVRVGYYVFTIIK